MTRLTDPRGPEDQFEHHRSAGKWMLGFIVFCLATGAGIGVVLERPEIGALIGGAVGILFGLLAVPGLLRDWHE